MHIFPDEPDPFPTALYHLPYKTAYGGPVVRIDEIRFQRLPRSVTGESTKRTGISRPQSMEQYRWSSVSMQMTPEVLPLSKESDDGELYEKFDTFLAGHMTHGRLSIDGIFCVTDKVAYYVMKALRRMNLRIPEDVQVIGFDGIRQLGDFDYICSTIVQPVEEMARISVGLLFQEPSSARLHTYCLPVTYVCGGSTREPAP